MFSSHHRLANIKKVISEVEEHEAVRIQSLEQSKVQQVLKSITFESNMIRDAINEARFQYTYGLSSVKSVAKELATFGLSAQYREYKAKMVLSDIVTKTKSDKNCLLDILTNPNYGSDLASLKYKIVSNILKLTAPNDEMAELHIMYCIDALRKSIKNEVEAKPVKQVHFK